MSTRRDTRTLHTSGRQKPPSTSRPEPVSVRSRPGKAEAEILLLVRTGVEKFILRNASIEAFFATLRAVEKKEAVYSHQLTRIAFSRIVREAMRKRHLGQ